jgi:hypothetical protein
MLYAAPALATVPAPGGGQASLASAAAATESFEVARSHKDTGAFKPDGVYGGGRGRDPYGDSLDADPYHAGGNRDGIKFAPPNAGLHSDGEYKKAKNVKKKDKDQDEDAGQSDRRRINPDDQDEDNRANRAAARSGGQANDEDEGSGE